MRNLVHDTAYRRARAVAAATLHALDGALRRPGAQRRVLFEAASPMSLAVFMPLYRRMCHDPRIEFWFSSCSRTWSPDALFADVGPGARVLPSSQLRWKKFDAYINTDFWDMTWMPRRTPRLHLFHGVAGKYGLDAPVRIAPVVRSFDRLLFPNRDRLSRYVNAGLVDGSSGQAALVGYPKVDCLVDGSLDRRTTLASRGIPADRPVVLYAPTWSPHSSLNSMGSDVIAALAQLDVTTIVKLHDRSYDTATRGSGGVDWNREIGELCARHGAWLVRDADASPWLHAADLLITDHSSVGFEYMLLDRPLVVLDCPELLSHARVNPDKVARLRSGAFVVRDTRAIATTVSDALAHPRVHAGARQQIADDLFFQAGTATGRALQCIYEVLDLPLPAGLLAQAPPERLTSWSAAVPSP